MALFRPARAVSLPRRVARHLLLAALAAGLFVLVALHMLLPDTLSNTGFAPSSFDWNAAHQFYPPKSIKSLPTGSARPLPRVQAPPTAFKDPGTPDPRRDAVREAFRRSWDAYKTHAWLQDELAPVKGGGKETFGGWGATLVDSLDTLWIMGFEDEFYEASDAMAGVDFGKTHAGAANLFETTIRHLGGLLAAYDLSGEQALLDKAVELGDMLYMGFDTPNRLPGFWFDFDKAIKGTQIAGTNDASAAPASLCLEFTRLSQITGDPKYYAATDRVTRFLEKIQFETSLPGLWPVTLDFRNERAKLHVYTLGALADSLYEYLPKMHALLGGIDDTYEKMYRGAMKPAVEHLLFRPMLPDNDDILFSGNGRVHPKNGVIDTIPEGQHLTCFAGGMFGLGGRLFGIDEHVDIGERLARGCGWAYGQFPTGLMPEVFRLIPCDSIHGCDWDESRWESEGDESLPKGWKGVREPKYMLRPEAIESIFLLYRMTGKEDLRDLAWDMFQGIVRSTETNLAYSAIEDVTVKGETKKTNSMEVGFLTLCVPNRTENANGTIRASGPPRR
jgi:mannosyl-oligosaccharide alpha-1,2-mannosidase